MSCSDRQMIIASQIAYIDFNMASVDSGQYTVRELLEMEWESASGTKRDQIDNVIRLIDEDSGECANWLVKDICDDNRRSGMYACMLETGDGEAIVAFRGSEDAKNTDNLVKDWIGSDLGLLNSTLTPQQAEAEDYMRRLHRKYGDQYDTINVTGHSLGGNLAEHATITAPDGMRKKIDRCVNLDGPGFSKAYLIAHANDIRKSQGRIDHFQWSMVGTLLNAAPGSNYQTVKADTPGSGDIWNIVSRHDMKNIKEYDMNGNLVSGEKDWLAKHTKQISILLENYLSSLLPLGTIGLAILYNYNNLVIDEIRNLYEWWQETFTQGGRAEFTMQASAIYRNLEELQDISRTVGLIRDETEQIRRNLSMHSLAVGSIKYKLWRTGNSIERLAGHLGRYVSGGEACVNLYQQYDRTIAEKYR